MSPGDSTEAKSGWAARPAAALAVRTAVLAVPIGAGVAAAVAVTRVLPRPQSLTGLVALWLIGVAVSTIVLLSVQREARRFLPLAALLELSLTFPDRTPSRLGVALRAGNLRKPERHRAALLATRGPDRAEAVEAVLALVSALSAHDRGTRGHSERVRAYTELVCLELHMPASDRLRLRWASLLHDVGKMSVPAALLNKTGALDDDDWATLRRHPEEGAKLAASLTPWLGEWAAAIEQHHERWDGTGYPHGLAGHDIHRGARIVAVADAFEVMTSARAYKKAVPAAEARRRLAADAGRQFDPDVVRAFLGIGLGRLRFAAGPIAWLAQAPFLRPAAALARGPVPVVLGGTLAAAVVALSMPALAPAAAPVAAPHRAASAQALGLEVARSYPAATVPVPAATVAAVPTSGTPTPTPGDPPPLATVGSPAPEPGRPPTGVPDPPPPAPEPQPTPTPLVLVSVHVGDPVDTELAAAVGDSSDAPVPPVVVQLSVGD